jgi:hypothetical protein
MLSPYEYNMKSNGQCGHPLLGEKLKSSVVKLIYKCINPTLTKTLNLMFTSLRLYIYMFHTNMCFTFICVTHQLISVYIRNLNCKTYIN